MGRYVGADLSALAVEAAMCAAKRSVDALEERKGDGDEAMCPTNITMDDFTAALGKVEGGEYFHDQECGIRFNLVRSGRASRQCLM